MKTARLVAIAFVGILCLPLLEGCSAAPEPASASQSEALGKSKPSCDSSITACTGWSQCDETTGKCEECGMPNEVPCTTAYAINKGGVKDACFAPLAMGSNGLCTCAGWNQYNNVACVDDGTCNVANGDTCVACGGAKEPTCTAAQASSESGCAPGFAYGSSTSCVACTGWTEPRASSSTPSTPVTCQACGGSGQSPCSAPGAGETGCQSGTVLSGSTCVTPCVPGTGHGTWAASANPIKEQTPFTLTIDWWSGSCQPTPGPITYFIKSTTTGAVWYQIDYSSGFVAMPNATQITFDATNLSTHEDLYLNAGQYEVQIEGISGGAGYLIGDIGPFTVE
jgi:hypothetical protein